MFSRFNEPTGRLQAFLWGCGGEGGSCRRQVVAGLWKEVCMGFLPPRRNAFPVNHASPEGKST